MSKPQEPWSDKAQKLIKSVTDLKRPVDVFGVAPLTFHSFEYNPKDMKDITEKVLGALVMDDETTEPYRLLIDELESIELKSTDKLPLPLPYKDEVAIRLRAQHLILIANKQEHTHRRRMVEILAKMKNSLTPLIPEPESRNLMGIPTLANYNGKRMLYVGGEIKKKSPKIKLTPPKQQSTLYDGPDDIWTEFKDIITQFKVTATEIRNARLFAIQANIAYVGACRRQNLTPNYESVIGEFTNKVNYQDAIATTIDDAQDEYVRYYDALNNITQTLHAHYTPDVLRSLDDDLTLPKRQNSLLPPAGHNPKNPKP